MADTPPDSTTSRPTPDDAAGTLDLYALRALAEAAGGYPGQRLHIVRREDGAIGVVPASEWKGTPETILFSVYTPRVGERREPPKLTLGLPGGKTRELDTTRYDAFFWTPEAVEKFVLPYYHRVGGVEEVERIRRSITASSEWVGIIHMADSTWIPCPDDGGEAVSRGGQEPKGEAGRFFTVRGSETDPEPQR